MIHHFLKTSHFIPNEYHHSFFDIDFKALYDQGFRYIITDLDNTLISYEEHEPTDAIRAKFDELAAQGFGIVLLSNNHPERLDRFRATLGIGGFASAKKPLVRGIRRAMASFPEATKENTLLIGDQLMTDVWGGNRFQLHVVLVDPIKKKTEKWYTKYNRRIESRMLEKIKRHYPDRFAALGLDQRG